MGYGKNLKNILDEKHMKVKELARKAGISATTLYSVISRDSSVRFDHATSYCKYSRDQHPYMQ